MRGWRTKRELTHVRSKEHITAPLDPCAEPSTRRRLEEEGGPHDEAARLRRLTQLNALVQMQNLRTHPCVQAALARGELDVHGWVYDIATGMVEAWDAEAGAFVDFPFALAEGQGI